MDAPELVSMSPVVGGEALALRPTFDWNPPSGLGTITGYTIQFSKNDTFTQIVHTGNPVISSYVPTADLIKDTPLFWRVQAKGTNGPSAWSDVWTFRSANSPTTPTLSSPASNLLIINYMPLFKWSVVTVPAPLTLKHYEVQVDDDPAFLSAYTDTSVSNLLTPQLQITDPNLLLHNTKYYWRVRAVNSNDEVSNWSTVLYFRTLMDAPILSTPDDGSSDVSTLPLLTWQNVTSNTGYILQVWKAGTTPVLIKTVTLPANVTQYQFITALLPGTGYYWKVQVKGPNGPSVWSEPFNFTTAP
jgi:hypothetical protein